MVLGSFNYSFSCTHNRFRMSLPSSVCFKTPRIGNLLTPAVLGAVYTTGRFLLLRELDDTRRSNPPSARETYALDSGDSNV